MTPPSRLQIEGPAIEPKYKVEFWNPVINDWVDIGDYHTVDISGVVESVGSQDNGLAFGTSVEPRATIITDRFVVDLTDRLVYDPYWLMKRCRIRFGFADSDYMSSFIGPIREISWKTDDVTIEVVSNLEYVRNKKFYTPLYHNKPIATATSVTSVEDPTDESYQGGLINLILWTCGGRPYDQKDITYEESDPDFKFWYSCQQSLLTPEWSWISSENLVDELFLIARAAGGQIYQDMEGVVKYINPLSFADLSSYGPVFTPFEYNDSHFETYGEKYTSYEQVGTVTCTYTPRTIQPLQIVYEDKTPRFFQPGETKTIILEPQWPVYTYTTFSTDGLVVAGTPFKITDLSGNIMDYFLDDVELYATKVQFTLTNINVTEPMIVHAITIMGRPITAGEDGIVTYGSGEPERNIENNPYIQSERYAKRITRMIYDFYAHQKPIVTMNGAIYDTDRYVGEIVRIISQYNQIYQGDDVYVDNYYLYRILNIRNSMTGTSMDIDCVSIEDLPTRDQMFIIGNTSYLSGTTRKVSY